MKRILFLLLGLCVATSAFAASSQYHVMKKLPLGGSGFWDYLTVDSEAGRSI